MARRHTTAAEDTGQDSFLDVVSNIVGILIILVMIVGGRMTQRGRPPEASASPEVAALERDVRELETTVVSAESEIEELQGQKQVVDAAAAGAADARLQLATAVAAAKVGLRELEAARDAEQVAAAGRAARRVEMEREIEQLEQEAATAAAQATSTQQVLAYPTPIGRTVNGEEIHFRLAAGRIAHIPIEELFELAKRHTQRQSGSLAALQARIETVGPARGFMLDYVLETKVDRARGQVLVRSREWVVRPAADDVGEPVDAALGSGSAFRRALADVRPETTVTLWCYPDAFADFRRVREELHRLGIPSAGRPLPDGAPIGGSTEGSKSVAQ